MNGLRSRCVAAVLALGIAGIGGCSGHDDPGPAGPGAGLAEDDATERGGDDLGPLPFDELLGLGGDAQELAERWADWSAGYPDAVTTCMRARGYRGFVEPVEPIPTREEIERSSVGTASDGLRDHGYGVAGNLQIQIDNAITDRSVTDAALPDWLAALSPAERQAFDSDSQDCRARALEQFPHPMGGGTDPEAAQAYFELAEVRLSLEEAPEVRSLWAEWAGCMGGRGWSAGRRADLVAELNAGAEPVVLALQDAQQSGGAVLSPDHPAVVSARRTADALADRERQMVADDLACAEPIDLDHRLHEVLHRVQSRYLAEHGDEVRRLIAAAGLAS